jgi:hypothetical protein
MNYIFQMASGGTINTSDFMTIDSSNIKIHHLNNFRGCNVGATDDRDL